MSKIQYVADPKTPFIKKLYGKENNFKVETLTYWGTLYELENLQNKVEVLEEALKLACANLEDINFKLYNTEMDFVEYFKTKAKEMIDVRITQIKEGK